MMTKARLTGLVLLLVLSVAGSTISCVGSDPAVTALPESQELPEAQGVSLDKTWTVELPDGLTWEQVDGAVVVDKYGGCVPVYLGWSVPEGIPDQWRASPQELHHRAVSESGIERHMAGTA